MADLVQTSANVRHVSGTTRWYTAKSVITAGMPIRLENNTEAYAAQADADANSTGTIGIALTNAGIDEQVNVHIGGNVNLGAALTTGEMYCVSAAAAGGIAPIADMTTGNWPVSLGFAISATDLQLAISRAGVAHA